MKKVVLVMLVIVCNIGFVSCESNDDFQEEMDLMEVSTNDGRPVAKF